MNLQPQVPSSSTHLTYDPNRRVTFLHDPNFSRCDFDWWIKNTSQPSQLFLNGTYVSEEVGYSDIRLLEAWAIQPNANNVLIGIVDMTTHMDWVAGFIAKVAPGVRIFKRPVARYQPDWIAGELGYCADVGCRAVVLAWGQSQPNADLQDACEYLASKNTMLICSLPNSPVDVDANPDYPASWQSVNKCILPVTSTDRTGQLYHWAGWGCNAVAAPGRNLIMDGFYSGGTSYAAGIVAGVVALSLEQQPDLHAAARVNLIRNTAIAVDRTRRINPVEVLSPKKNKFAPAITPD